MTERCEDPTRRAAVAVGQAVEQTLSLAVDKLEDLSLWIMEQAAKTTPQSEGLSQVSRVLDNLRRLTVPMPRLAGRLASRSTYFGLRAGAEMYRAARKALEESSEFMAEDARSGEK